MSSSRVDSALDGARLLERVAWVMAPILALDVVLLTRTLGLEAFHLSLPLLVPFGFSVAARTLSLFARAPTSRWQVVILVAALAAGGAGFAAAGFLPAVTLTLTLLFVAGLVVDRVRAHDLEPAEPRTASRRGSVIAAYVASYIWAPALALAVVVLLLGTTSPEGLFTRWRPAWLAVSGALLIGAVLAPRPARRLQRRASARPPSSTDAATPGAAPRTPRLAIYILIILTCIPWGLAGILGFAQSGLAKESIEFAYFGLLLGFACGGLVARRAARRRPPFAFAPEAPSRERRGRARRWFEQGMAAVAMTGAIYLMAVGNGRRLAREAMAQRTRLATVEAGAVPDADNAAVQWRQALRVLGAPRSEPTAGALLEENEQLIDLVLAAAARPEAQWSTDRVPATEWWRRTLAPDAARLSPMLQRLTGAAARQGRWQLVVQLLDAHLELAGDIASYRESCRVFVEAAASFELALGEQLGGALDLDQLASLETFALAALERRPRLARALARSRAFEREMIDLRASGVLPLPEARHFVGAELHGVLVPIPRAPDVLCRLPVEICWPSAIWSFDVAEFPDTMQRLVDLAESAEAQRDSGASLRKLRTEFLSVAPHPAALACARLVRVYAPDRWHALTCMSAWNRAALLAAILAYRHRESSWPNTLDDLGLPESRLIDPLVGSRFRAQLETSASRPDLPAGHLSFTLASTSRQLPDPLQIVCTPLGACRMRR